MDTSSPEPGPASSVTTGALGKAEAMKQTSIVWAQAQQQLGSACGNRILSLAGQKVHPVPAHWTSTDETGAETSPALYNAPSQDQPVVDENEHPDAAGEQRDKSN